MNGSMLDQTTTIASTSTWNSWDTHGSPKEAQAVLEQRLQELRQAQQLTEVREFHESKRVGCVFRMVVPICSLFVSSLSPPC
jgi:hypothetical protein